MPNLAEIEEIARLEESTRVARHKLERVQFLEAAVRQLLVENADILKKSHAAPKLFEAGMWLENDIKRAVEWVKREETRLFYAQRAADGK